MGDEEASDDECALIVLKRPPVTERTVEEVEVMEDDDIAMCGEGTGSINAKEKDGYVKEYIETEGLAMILSKVTSHPSPYFFNSEYRGFKSICFVNYYSSRLT